MTDAEYAYAQNWIEQFRRGLQKANARGHLNSYYRPRLSLRENLDYAYLNLFWWDGTPEHHSLWCGRHFERRNSFEPPTR